MDIRRSPHSATLAHLGPVLSLALLGTLPSGCKAPSLLVLGFATDLSAPDRLDQIEMRVSNSDGVRLLSHSWILPGLLAEDFHLPGSFSLVADEGSAPIVRVELIGTRGENNPKDTIVREARVAFAPEQDLFLRMAIVDACRGVVCAAESTCVEGRCRPIQTNRVSLTPYERGMESQVACSSGSRFIDTATKQPMPTEGDGYCAPDQWCGESTCYRNQGQGLLWCNDPNETCAGVDGYEECVLSACDSAGAACYGEGWREGRFSGICADYATCRSSCACDPSCIARCDADRSSECATCVETLDGCRLQGGSTCAQPSCTPIPGPSTDGGMPVGDGGTGPTPDSIQIPSGTYFIGCSMSDAFHPDPGCAFDAQPAHAVSVPQYHIDRFEVTQVRYSQCVVAGTCPSPIYPGYAPATTPNLPVVAVTWDEASAFCAWAGAQQGKMGRLPLEVEWEVAAHGNLGMTGPGGVYPWGDQLPMSDCSLAVTVDCVPGVQEVGLHPLGASPFLVEDMAGNVHEWVGDWYDPASYVLFPGLTGPQSGDERVKRGGSFASVASDVTATIRFHVSPDTSSNEIGFRCVYIP